RRSYAQATGADLDDDDADRDGELTAEQWDELSADEDDADIVAERAAIKARRRSQPRRRPSSDAPQPSDLFADWADVEARLASATTLEQLGLDDDAESSAISAINAITNHQSPITNELPAHRIRCQPAIEMRGRVADWVADIRRLRDDGDTTLFVAATPGR